MGVHHPGYVQGCREDAFREARLSRQRIRANVENRLHARRFEVPNERLKG
jgi:hypothetical protein